MTIINRCARCGVTIYLAPVGMSYKWVTDITHPSQTWKCQATRDYLVRAHHPYLAVSR